MTQLTFFVRAVFPAVVAVTLLSGTTLLVTPEPVEAQNCSACMFNGSNLGAGQPGGGFDCVSMPEGAARCHLGPGYCYLEGECQELMWLDFSEDGTASRSLDRPLRQTEGEARDRTCDGVLLPLRTHAESDRDTSQRDNTHTLVL